VLKFYVFTVYVKNTALPLVYDSTTVLVRVLDVNDNAPVFQESVYLLEVPENADLAVIHTAAAADADSRINALITYRIAGEIWKYIPHPPAPL